MRALTVRFCGLSVAMLVAAVQVAQAADPNAAHTIAEKFSAASSNQSSAVAKTDAAKARAKAEKAKALAQAARAAAQKREQELSRQRQADELDMLARAKAEAVLREAEQKRAEDDLIRAEAAEAALEAEAVRRVQANRAAADQREAAATAATAAAATAAVETATRDAAERAETEKKAALEAQREAETLRLAERLKEARRAKAAELDRLDAETRERSARSSPPIAQPPNGEPRDAQPSSVTPPEIGPAPTVATGPAAVPAAVTPRPPLAIAAIPASPASPAQASPSNRATVLLVVQPGTYGIRRWNPTQADPVLCLGDTCYVSQGTDKPAKSMTRSLALGTGNTLGARAGACKGQLGCVFRDVDFGPSGRADLQPVDLHILRHDRREVTSAGIDRSCAARDGRLTCSAPVMAQTYRMQVIPEATAAAIEPSTLATSLATLGNSKLATSH